MLVIIMISLLPPTVSLYHTLMYGKFLLKYPPIQYLILCLLCAEASELRWKISPLPCTYPIATYCSTADSVRCFVCTTSHYVLPIPPNLLLNLAKFPAFIHFIEFANNKLKDLLKKVIYYYHLCNPRKT